MLLFKESRKTDHLVSDVSRREDQDSSQGIRCPQCAWRPSPTDLWCCLHTEDSPEPPFPSCGAIWHTFATRGRCSGCGHRWKWTSCLRCSQWSLHEDWYEHERH